MVYPPQCLLLPLFIVSAALTSEQQYSPMCELHNRSIFFRLRRRRSHRYVTMALPVREYLLDTFEYVLDTLIGYNAFALPIQSIF